MEVAEEEEEEEAAGEKRQTWALPEAVRADP